MDNKYTPISRRTISEKQIPVLVRTVKETILKKLETQSSVSLTTDLWSDRRLRSFLGVTAHVCKKSKDSDSYALESYLLDCRHFTGRHSGERITSAFEEITEEYGIRQKISYIITDNAANMKCAFKVHMPQQQSDDSESEEESLDDEHLWEDMNLVEDTELPWSSGERLSCFAHSLHLVVNDGMKEVRAISRTIAKTSRFTTLLHSSSQFKEKFEAMFDSNKTIPAANTTRWNSTFKQDYENVMFSACEWNQLKELSAVLAPFSEATDQTEGDKSVTISMVVPTALHQSLVKRFSGIFTKTNMAKESGGEEPFSHNVYFLATMLDPQFGLSWVDLDVNNGGNATSVKKLRDELKKTLTDTLISEVEKISSEGEATDSEAMNVDLPSDSPPVKFPRLLIETQISKYFDAIHDTDTDTDNALSFWAKNHDRYPQLHNLAMKVLSVPASSAPVERVFSRGGIIMRPHRARLGHKMLQSLIFLKCNQMLL
ncbi:hypothetical protein ABG768_007347 [Culter alburnus]|uniref:HAT C-terminal dimerisation domain-containing protein n=1 Tax=Culter alburnus TaxID=194366 RepID=A0AAW1ZM59_CULAL